LRLLSLALPALRQDAFCVSPIDFSTNATEAIMTGQPRRYDTLHVGRATIDFYSNDVGKPFSEIESFAAYVDGFPTNICVGATRLGNACGAVVVTKHGCANFMPTFDEVMAFVESRGGW
jgi:sugar/nucleoside kinase (ribokinase family)